MQLEETTTYLEMTDRRELLPAREPQFTISVVRAEIPSLQFSRFLYTAVGSEFYWIDRLAWSDEQWLSYLSRPGTETWVGYCTGTPCGYFELEPCEDNEICIASFGLLPRFVGKGIGGHLLTVAIRRAWEGNPNRVWLHTSSFDHPHALTNYQARGFQIVRRETALKEIPDHFVTSRSGDF